MLQHESNGGGKALPVGLFALELFASGARERIVPGATIVLAGAPLGLNPALLFEAVESGVERALLDLEDVAGNLLDALGDPPSMHGFEGNGFQDEQVKGALQQIHGVGQGNSPRYSTGD